MNFNSDSDKPKIITMPYYPDQGKDKFKTMPYYPDQGKDKFKTMPYCPNQNKGMSNSLDKSSQPGNSIIFGKNKGFS